MNLSRSQTMLSLNRNKQLPLYGLLFLMTCILAGCNKQNRTNNGNARACWTAVTKVTAEQEGLVTSKVTLNYSETGPHSLSNACTYFHRDYRANITEDELYSFVSSLKPRLEQLLASQGFNPTGKSKLSRASGSQIDSFILKFRKPDAAVLLRMSVVTTSKTSQGKPVSNIFVSLVWCNSN